MRAEDPTLVPVRKTAEGDAVEITKHTTWLNANHDQDPQAIILAIAPLPQPGKTAHVVAYVPVIRGSAGAYYSSLTRAMNRVQFLLDCPVAAEYQMPAGGTWYPVVKEIWEL